MQTELNSFSMHGKHIGIQKEDKLNEIDFFLHITVILHIYSKVTVK